MIFQAVFLAVLVFGAFGAVDAAVRPFSHWQRVHRSKAAWIVGQALVLFPVLDIIGLVAIVSYFVAIRPKLRAVAAELPTV